MTRLKSEKSERSGTIRKILPREADAFADHLLRLDKKSRRMRFAHSVPDKFIRDYATRMSDNDAVVYGYFEEGEIRAAAELRKLGPDWDSEAEAAFSVEPDYQGRGLGSDLFGRIIRSARNRGLSHLYLSCLPDNQRMQAIANKYDAELRFEYGDVVGDIVPQAPDYVSILSEAVEDKVGYMLGVLDIRNRLKKTRVA